ncbi:YebG family protein [Colwellia sp. RSH04]|uniref:YebG family protein n=1 Tax=Colwellia sp. RSH04 TaxID=2305464 RepID=UPI000E5761BF|nr:YebG family protein [Colwellia sp. RSH04]RHW77736.1 hypothetical protein D1094_02010 [Colwellia sp. RSH04]
MAVESRFVVIRHGVEAKTFMDKKSADEYDKMLDMADNLAEVFAQAPIELADNLSEELSIYLAQNREEVLVALLAKKATKKVVKKSEPTENVSSDAEQAAEQNEEKVKKKPTKAKAVKLSEAS